MAKKITKIEPVSVQVALQLQPKKRVCAYCRVSTDSREQQNSFSAQVMSNEAVEYIRGIPVVKAFGQTVFSFKRFKDSIDRYFKFVMQYTISCRKLMIAYTTVINSVFVFLIAGTMFFSEGNITQEFILNLLFYIIITPIISLTLTRIMYQSENKMIVQDALKRIDSILEIKPRSCADESKSPKDSSVSIQNVSFGYEDGNNVIHNISMDISAGSTVALVGPSGGGKTTLASLIARFYDASSSSISIGGVDIRKIEKEELMYSRRCLQMKNIKRVVENETTKSVAPKEQSFHPQSQEFNIFMNTSASVVEKHGAEILKELDCVV